MNRAELQRLAIERIDDAKALLAVLRWPGAYYLAGYSIECALKSCVLAYIERTGIIFREKKYAEGCWTHDLEKLVNQAGLGVDRDKATYASPQLGANWQIVKDWSEESRYNIPTQLQAEKLVKAIDDNSDGVLEWLKNYW